MEGRDLHVARWDISVQSGGEFAWDPPWQPTRRPMPVRRAMRCTNFRSDHDHRSAVQTAATAVSAMHAPFMELLRGGAELTQLVHGCSRWRERERLERFSEHRVEVVTRSDARGEVRAEMLAG